MGLLGVLVALDRGNRMSPTHANKRGVRYRYYVSHAILQNRKTEVGSIARVPAPDIENLVCDGVRRHLAASGEVEPPTTLADRDLIERHVERVIIKPEALEVCAAIVDGTAPADLTVTGLAKALPYSWAEQEQRIGLSS